VLVTGNNVKFKVKFQKFRMKLMEKRRNEELMDMLFVGYGGNDNYSLVITYYGVRWYEHVPR